MRAREFMMKDAYSFHLDDASLEQGYQAMYDAYTRIFTRMRLSFRAVHADTGSIGGSASQEFHVLADSGEDAIAFSDGDDYAANLEMAEALPPPAPRPRAGGSRCAKVATPGRRAPSRSSARSSASPPTRCLKTLLVEGSDGGVVALLVRGDHELNAVKAQKLPGRRARRCAWRAPEQVRAADRLRARLHRARRASQLPGLRRPRGARRWPISSAAPTRRTCTSPASTGAATCRSREVVGPAQRRGRRPEPDGPGHARASRAASRSATSSSSAASTARP